MARILIAEDEEDIRNLIGFTLNFAGHQVTATVNGEQALQEILENRPDLVLLDVRMPRMSGYEACAIIKSNELTRDIPVVFLSAKGQENEIQTGMEKGAQEYILKPFSPGDLIQKINQILAQNLNKKQAT